MFDPNPLQHPLTPPASLLIAALALLRQRCPRNELNAALLLHRAALSSTLSLAEREVCHSLADELER